jgi:hypothetical protein
MVAIQNWNSYMNAMNNAVDFASSMLGFVLPGIVSDFYPNPASDVTTLDDIGKAFTTVLGIIPFTGPFKTASSAITGGLNFVMTVIKPPTLPNLFLDWSNIATSLATILEGYQDAISSAITTTLNVPVNSSTGINSLLVGGGFLGVTLQNFTESDIQSALIDYVVSTYDDSDGSISCIPGQSGISSGPAYACVNITDGITEYLLTQNDGGDANDLSDFADLLINKYGISQQEFLIGPSDCFNANGGQQLTDPFNGSIPIDPTTPCLFNILVCNAPSYQGPDIIGQCQALGLPI